MKNDFDLIQIHELARRDIVLALHNMIDYARMNHIPADLLYQIVKVSGSIHSNYNRGGTRLPALEQKVFQILQELESYSLQVDSAPQQTDIVAEELNKKSNSRAQVKYQPKIVCSGKDLFKKYKKFTLKNVSFSLSQGEITGLVGENGNGKSTLLKIIAGDLAPDKGVLEYPMFGETGEEKDWERIKTRISYLPQELPRVEGTVENALRYEASINYVNGATNGLEVDFWISRLGLEQYRENTWDQLSGGYKLRLSLALAMISNPSLLVLDEPLANLDIAVQTKFLKDLRELARSLKNPVAIILSSLHVEEIEIVADTVLLLQDGKVTFNGSRRDLRRIRNQNIYELRCPASFSQLRLLLKNLEIERMVSDGFTFFIFASQEITGARILRELHDHVEVLHFSDISDSTKIIIKGYDLSFQQVH
jgi:ABC-2 type transport system ATP-binding protein